jgi:hypothetical protein
MSDRHLFKIDDGELHWYSALSAQEATTMHKEHYAFPDDQLNIDEIVQLADEEELTVFVEDVEESKVTRTARQWATEKSGFIASSVW